MVKSKIKSRYKCDLDWDNCEKWNKCPYNCVCLDFEDDDDYLDDEYSSSSFSPSKRFYDMDDDELLESANRLNLFTTIFGGGC